MMVAMNPQTWDGRAEIEPGGYLFYDSTKPLPAIALPRRHHVIGMPLTEICNATYTDPRQRQLFKNIIYVGALSVLLDIDPAVIEQLFAEQYKGKERCSRPTCRRCNLGRDFARSTCRCPMGIRVRCAPTRWATASSWTATAPRRWARLWRRHGLRLVPDHAVHLGGRGLQKLLRQVPHDPETGKNNYAIVQAEDELASIGMVVGAGWNGARAFTATSGPGVSLMTEFIGLAYFAEIPVTVIINVQRGGPSTGMPTRTQQADLLACAYASHGDTKHVLLFPEDPHECFEHSAAALRSGRPAADAGLRHDRPRHRHEPAPVRAVRLGRHRALRPRQGDDAEELEAGKDFGRYKDVDGDGIPYRTYARHAPDQGRYFTRGTTRNAYARTPSAGPTTSTTCSGCCASSRRRALWCRSRAAPAPKPTRFGVIYFGSTSPAMDEALDVLEAEGIISTRCACAPSRSPTRSASSSPRTTACSWSSRTATRRCARCWSTSWRSTRAKLCRSCTTTARRSPRASSSHPSSPQRGACRNANAPRSRQRPRMTYIAKPKLHHPTLPEEQGRLHPARLRGQGLHAVRRLRARLDLGRHHPGLLGARHRAAPRRQALRHRLLVEDARLLPRRQRTASTPCTAACPRC
jgi:2-oxoglutarate ferredoxin oxidoreductase subunit alpha